MTHPFLFLPSTERHILVACSSALTVVGIVVLWFTDPGRLSGKGPSVVGFELAGTAAKAKSIMEDWGELGRTVAAFNLGFDYVFILGYSTLMTLGCLWATQRYSSLVLIKLGVLFAWLQWLAGALDCVEDASLLKMLFRGPSDLAAGIARISASGKFGLLVLGLGYMAMSIL